MEDIVPELYKRIKDEFDGLVSEDVEIQAILSGHDKTKTLGDVSLIARRIGEYVSDSLCDNFTDDSLPDGKLYWNIMERTIVPIMYEAYELIDQLYDIVLRRMYEKQKIGIKPQKSEFPLERIHDLMNKIANDLGE